MRSRLVVVLLALAAPLLAAPLQASPAVGGPGGTDRVDRTGAAARDRLVVEVLSTRADLVSAGDALVAIRIPAGAALAASVFGADHAAMAVVAALLGGGFAATAHAAKATTRAAINTSPEPFSNIGTSLVEDAAVPTGLWLAVAHPLVFLVLFVLLLVFSVWLIRKSWRFLRGLVARLTRIFSGKPDPGVEPAFRLKKSSTGDTPNV